MQKFLFTWDIKQLLFGVLFYIILTVSCILSMTIWFVSPIGQIFAAIILGVVGVNFILRIISGGFLTLDWFKENGIRTEAAFVRVDTKYQSGMPGGMSGGGWNTYSIVLQGVNPITQKQQKFEQSCSKNANLFRRGDMLTVYLHPKRPKWAYRIDCEPRSK